MPDHSIVQNHLHASLYLGFLAQEEKNKGNRSNSSSSSIYGATQTDTQLTWWVPPLGVCFLLVAITAGVITAYTAAGAFNSIVSSLGAVQLSGEALPWTSGTVLKGAIMAAVWFDIVLLLAAATATLAWNAVVLLHPLLSGGHYADWAHLYSCDIERQPQSIRECHINTIDHVNENTATVIAVLVSVTLTLWYVLYVYDPNTPATLLHVLLLIAVLGLSSMVFFSMTRIGFVLFKAAHAQGDADNQPPAAMHRHLADSNAEWQFTAAGEPVLVAGPQGKSTRLVLRASSGPHDLHYVALKADE